MGTVRVGISGWRYPGWRGAFYPAGLVQRRELEYAAGRLTSIEVNGTFYSLQRPTSFARWRDETPDGFVFAVKGGRFITHMKRLADAEGALATFFAQGVLALGPKLGPVLWQLPATLGFDAERLDAFFAKLPHTTAAAADLAARHDGRLATDATHLVTDVDRPVRHALEPRHPSFDHTEARAVCGAHDIALVLADTAGRWPRIDADTATYRYVRLHGDAELYASGYSQQALDTWAATVGGWASGGQDVYVYFDNDAKVRAPYDAMGLISRLRETS